MAKDTGEEIFTKDQLKAINHDSGPILVVAGAGTGKTSVITSRIARLILTKKAKPEEVLALTFTDKAASEMQQRVDEMLPYGFLDTQIMTFHALAEKLLREFALDIGLSTEFTILSDIQQTIILQEVLNKADFSYYSPQHDPFDFIDGLKTAISRLKDEGIDSSAFEKSLEKDMANMGEDLVVPMRDLASIYSQYSKLMQSKNSLDFGDLMIKLQHLLKTRKSIRQQISSRYKYLLVDEFQDTNSIQMQIVRLLLTDDNNIMVVGDDDQAIYRFRGASVANILSFRKVFKEAEIVVLRDNFRSGQAILDAGYALIQHNNPDRLEFSEKINKKLVANTNPDAYVSVNDYPHKLSEADGVVDKISELISAGLEPNQIAVLLRKNNQLKPYILALQKQKIGYYVHQDVELFDQASVKVMLNLTKVICDPLDSAALFQLLISGFFKKIETQEVIRLSAMAKRANDILEQAIADQIETLEWAEMVLRHLEEWRADLSDLSAGESLYLAIKSTGYLKGLLNEAGESVESALAVQYLTDFFKLVKQFESVSNKPNLVEFSRYLDDIKQASGDVMSEISPLDNNGVQLMTVHKAKGLEFDYVFLPEMTEQNFPTYRRADKVKIAENLLKSGGGDHYQEERRLFYVALTRARRGLELSFALNHGGKRPKKPSRFIAEAIGPDWQHSSKQHARQTDIAEFIESFQVGTRMPLASPLARLYRGDWLYLSTNQIADYQRSPREFWLFHVLCLPKGPFHTLVYGSSVHAALEHYYKFRIAKKPIKAHEIIEVYEQSWKSEGFASKQHEQSLFQTGKKAILEYIKSHENDELLPIAIEQPFELQLPKLKTVISGRYDIVLEGKQGTEIRDFKTSRVKDQKAAESKAKSSIQLGIYALSWEKIQQKSIYATSLEFIQDLRLGRNTKIDHDKTMEVISSTVDSIKKMQFSEKGQSTMDFDKLLL